jgi:hypothetical protein
VWRNCGSFIVENPACEETKSTMSIMDSPLDNLFLEDFLKEVLVPHTKRRRTEDSMEEEEEEKEQDLLNDIVDNPDEEETTESEYSQSHSRFSVTKRKEEERRQRAAAPEKSLDSSMHFSSSNKSDSDTNTEDIDYSEMDLSMTRGKQIRKDATGYPHVVKRTTDSTNKRELLRRALAVGFFEPESGDTEAFKVFVGKSTRITHIIQNELQGIHFSLHFMVRLKKETKYMHHHYRILTQCLHTLCRVKCLNCRFGQKCPCLTVPWTW